MSKKVTFQLNVDGGAYVLDNMAVPMINKSGQAVYQRAKALIGDDVSLDVSVRVNDGSGARGRRAIATISTSSNKRDAWLLLKKSIDGGKV